MLESCDESGMVRHLEHKFDRNGSVKTENHSRTFSRSETKFC